MGILGVIVFCILIALFFFELYQISKIEDKYSKLNISAEEQIDKLKIDLEAAEMSSNLFKGQFERTEHILNLTKKKLEEAKANFIALASSIPDSEGLNKRCVGDKVFYWYPLENKVLSGTIENVHINLEYGVKPDFCFHIKSIGRERVRVHGEDVYDSYEECLKGKIEKEFQSEKLDKILK